MQLPFEADRLVTTRQTALLSHLASCDGPLWSHSYSGCIKVAYGPTVAPAGGCAAGALPDLHPRGIFARRSARAMADADDCWPWTLAGVVMMAYGWAELRFCCRERVGAGRDVYMAG